jgi:Putative metal-binding motif
MKRRQEREVQRARWWQGVVAAALAIGGMRSLAHAELVCERLAAPITDHTCFHTRFGPFKDVRAVAPGSAPRGEEHLNDVHTYHAVSLPGSSGAGALPYTPARSGFWAFYLQHEVALEVRDGAGRALPVLHEDEVRGCPHLARVEVVELVAGMDVEVVLGPTTASEVGVVIEKLDDFGVFHGRDRDGDGYGDPAQSSVSPCLPAAGWVANDEDCDDADREIHPGAAELCGQADRNCNGIDGDVGASCQVGRGACAVTGTFSCAADGAAPVCEAVASAPAAEQCNGIDDDCDGVADATEDGLCADEAVPRCVADGRGGGFCGCERDADCGDAESGRLCWTSGTEQRCIEGCVEGFGRNSCAKGQRCTSRDPANPGTCEEDEADPGGCQASGATSAGLWAVALLLGLIASRRRARVS